MIEESIQLLKPGLRKRKPTIFRPKEMKPIEAPVVGGYWGAYAKEMMLGELRNISRRKIRLVRKEVYDAAEYYYIWRELKKIGIPTIDSMRVTEDDNYVLMTDLSRLGAKSYGKERRYFWNEMHQQKNISDPFNDLDSIFASIPLDEITREIERISELASRKGVLLPTDDPLDLFIFPDGSWRIMVLDLTALQFADNKNTLEAIGNDNAKNVQKFLTKIEYMHRSVVAPGLEPGTSRM